MQGKRHEEPESPRIARLGQPVCWTGGHASEFRSQADVEGAATTRHRPQVAGRLVIAERHAAQRQIIALVEQVLDIQAQSDRNSVVLVKSVSVRLDLGGLRIINKNYYTSFFSSVFFFFFFFFYFFFYLL